MVSAHDVHTGGSARLIVLRAENGWEIREERDNETVRVTHHTDWHRVERSVRMFEGTIVTQRAEAH